MRFAAWLGLGDPWESVVDLSQHLDATGWDGIYFADHFIPNSEDRSAPMQECWTSLAALAALTSRVRLGSLVTANTFRHPALLAKMAAQVDIVSGGRAVLGLGAGRQQNEHDVYGIEFGTLGARMRRLEESAQVIRSLLRNERTTFSGGAFALADAPLVPRPVGPLPLLIGGGGEQRTLRIVSQHADEWNVWASPSILRAKGAVLDQHCESVGRDPAEIRRSAQAVVTVSNDPAVVREARASDRPSLAGSVGEVVDTLGEYAEAGLSEFVVPSFSFGHDEKGAYDRFMQDVVPQLR
ncbi:MAG: TIGR03560 family F420-dependent LLM class oxidoreductase [Chloroflexi bacterium]|nr:TIGR03560 family F420-dependent LLM class oxidoreductase [Chloroflexota bacterium]